MHIKHFEDSRTCDARTLVDKYYSSQYRSTLIEVHTVKIAISLVYRCDFSPVALLSDFSVKYAISNCRNSGALTRGHLIAHKRLLFFIERTISLSQSINDQYRDGRLLKRNVFRDLQQRFEVENRLLVTSPLTCEILNCKSNRNSRNRECAVGSRHCVS